MSSIEEGFSPTPDISTLGGRDLVNAIRETELDKRDSYRIFFDLEDTITGRKVWSSLLPRIQEGHVKNILVMGMPGVGKTTWSVQAGKFLRENLNRPVRAIHFDVLLAEMVAEQGPYEHWESPEWDAFSAQYEERLREPADKDTVTIAEVVVVGRKNRGRTAAVNIANDPELAPQTMFMGFQPDRRVHQQARMLRERVAASPELEVVDLLRNHNMVIDGMPEYVEEEHRFETGRKIKLKFGNMAPSARIRVIDEEVLSVMKDHSNPFHSANAHRVIDLTKDVSEMKQSSQEVSEALIYMRETELHYRQIQNDYNYMTTLSSYFAGGAWQTVYNAFNQNTRIVWPWSYFTEE